MKHLFIAVALLTLIACNNNREADKPAGYFDWLIGSWHRTNEEVGKTTTETWEKNNDSTYTGISFTLQGTDTVWMENVLLRKVHPDWFYLVTQQGGSHGTAFKLTDIQKLSFVCENKLNEFPKKIAYFGGGDKLLAVISGDSSEIKFDFQKM